MKTPTARYFQPKEEYAPPKTHADSPFQKFVVHCLHCGSFKLKVISEFSGEPGETGIFLGRKDGRVLAETHQRFRLTNLNPELVLLAPRMGRHFAYWRLPGSLGDMAVGGAGAGRENKHKL